MLRSKGKNILFDEKGVFGRVCRHEYPKGFLNVSFLAYTVFTVYLPNCLCMCTNCLYMCTNLNFYCCSHPKLLIVFFNRIAYSMFEVQHSLSSSASYVDLKITYDLSCTLEAHLQVSIIIWRCSSLTVLYSIYCTTVSTVQ